jgi:hypothetical protein
MRALRQPPHDVFRAHDGHGEALGVAVDGRADVQPAGAQQVVAGGEIGERVGHMLDHFHVEHHVEALARRGEVFGAGVAVVDFEAGLPGMDLRHGNVARGGIGTHHLSPEPRHRLGQQAAATADIEQAQPGEGALARQVAVELGGDLGGDVVETARVEHVQRLELAVRIPPFGGHRLEFRDLGGVDRALGGLHSRLPVAQWGMSGI